ncbi:hypothetical protein BGZ73_000661, partial [Actinomortierella ambigua]
MVRSIFFVCAAVVLGMASSASALSCGDQAGSRGVRCVNFGRNCPSGFRPVFYDNPRPCQD